MEKMETNVEVWSFGTNDDNKEKTCLAETAPKSGDQSSDDRNSRRHVSAKSGHNSGPVLYIRDAKRKSESDPNTCFTNHQKIGSFRIDSNQSYDDLNCDTNPINDSNDFDAISKMNIDLMEGFENSQLIRDYKSYKLLKWNYFLKWIQRHESECLANRSAETVPEFVAFGGLFTSLLMTPNRFESWTLLVSKFNETIFMNKVRLNESKSSNQFGNQSKTNNNNNQFFDKNPYFAAKVTQIITQSDRELIEPEINEFEKNFTVYETQIAEHRLLLMSEMDAIDEEGNQYEIKCCKNGVKYGQKLSNWWSHSVVADVDYILIGVRDENDILKRIDRLKVEELSEMSEFRTNTTDSYDFVNRVLDYIKALLESANQFDTYRVWFWKRENCVKSAKINANSNPLLPNWFTSGAVESDSDSNQWH